MGLRSPRIPAVQVESGFVRQKTSFFKGKTAARPLEDLFFPAIPLVSVPSNHSCKTKGADMADQMTKSQLIEKIAETTELTKKDVKGVLENLATLGYKELKKNGVFLVPGFAKFVVIKKPATKARKGTNPFTGEAMTFKAKPARKIVRARPVKAAKDAV
jgi:nucleoid DNA-binding protein